MKLMTLTLLTAIRDEANIIKGWSERAVFFNPKNLESVGFVEEISKAQVLMTSGRCLPVEESCDEVARRFEEATS